MQKKASVNQVIRLTVDTRSSDENEPMTDTEGTPQGDLARACLGIVFDLPGLIQPARLGVAPIGHKIPWSIDGLTSDNKLYPQSH